MNRRSLMGAFAAMFATPALPAKAEPQPNWARWQWGREVVVCDGTCSFVMLPLLDGDTSDNLVVSLIITHIFYGERATCEARLAELETRHVKRPASSLALMGHRELAYQGHRQNAT